MSRPPRNKATIIASGIDPELKQLRRLQSIKSNYQKRYIAAIEGVEDYWDRVIAAAEAKQTS